VFVNKFVRFKLAAHVPKLLEEFLALLMINVLGLGSKLTTEITCLKVERKKTEWFPTR
jgi:hypothetical protein